MNNLALHQEYAPGQEAPGTRGALSGLIASSGVDVFVLSADPALVDIVRGLVGNHPSVSFSGDWKTLAGAVDAGRCDIVLLDMDHVGAALDKRLAELERSVAPPVVVAASGFKDAPELMRALTERRIHRLLLKPASPGNTRLLLEAAIHRSLQRLAHASVAVAPCDEEGAPRPAAGGSGRRRGKRLAVAMSLVFIAVLVAGLWQTRPGDPAPVVEPTPTAAPSLRAQPVAEPAPAPDPLAEPLARARAAAAAAEAQARAARERPKAPPPAQPREPDRLPAISAPPDAGDPGQAEARRQEHEAGLLASALERLRDGQLVAPGEDSAAHYLALLRSENPAHPGLAAPLQALTATLVENFEAAVAAGNLDEGESWLGGLERLGADAAFVGALAGELAVARRQDEFLRNAAPAEALVLVSSRAPVYPMKALAQGIEGWVELEFIVDRDGRPRDIVVTDAVPSGAFDRAAASAVARHRYEPLVVDNVSYERRVRLRMRFALN